MSRQFVLGFVIVTSAILIFAAWQLNPLAFYLSPVALAIVFFYSYTKRFTRWAHVALGVAWACSRRSRLIAVRGTFDPRILLLTGAVMFWGAGFDILYSCQDYEFDHAPTPIRFPRPSESAIR